MYIASYRKWRPLDFESLIGQDHITTTLKNALLLGKTTHAYLFTGPRGTGKTSAAKIFAKALNCENDPLLCNTCLSCQKITAGSSMDVFEIDAASNRGIDEIRQLRDTIKFAPVDGRYKVYIIDEVHMLTAEAFNALLKTLEEPPSHVVFILATTEAHKIPATILSRCQRYDFRRISSQDICLQLLKVAEKSSLRITKEAAQLIAEHSDGSLRDALSILDQCAAFSEEKITEFSVRHLLGLVGQEYILTLIDALEQKDAPKALLLFDELMSKGKDPGQILTELAGYLRKLMLANVSPDFFPNLSQSKSFTHEELANFIQLFFTAARESKGDRIPAEIALLSACRRSEVFSLEKRLAALEAKIKSIPQFSPEPLENLWKTVLGKLEEKRSVHACVRQGTLVQFDNQKAVIAFKNKFAKERAESNDFKAFIETSFEKTCGKKIIVTLIKGE